MKTIKTREIFFSVVLTYNLLLGLCLKEFIVLSQTVTASVLPSLFLLIEPRARAMKAIAYIALVLDIFMNAIYYICCRRLLPVMTMLLLVTELMYYITGAVRADKDSLLTKFVQAVTSMPKKCKQSTVGSFKTLSTIMITTHSSNILMFAEHYAPTNVSATISPIFSLLSAATQISLATLLTESRAKTQRSTLGIAFNSIMNIGSRPNMVFQLF